MKPDPAIITALISGLCVAIPTSISVIVTSNARDAVNEERIKHLAEKIDALDTKVQMHNTFAERIAVVEHDLKTAFRRIDEMRERAK